MKLDTNTLIQKSISNLSIVTYVATVRLLMPMTPTYTSRITASTMLSRHYKDKLKIGNYSISFSFVSLILKTNVLP